MLFLCLGAMLWYFLLYQAQLFPRILAVWGLLAVPLIPVATLLLVSDRSLDPSRVLYAPYVPYELTMDLWLVFKGASVPSSRAVAGGAVGTEKEISTKAPHRLG